MDGYRDPPGFSAAEQIAALEAMRQQILARRSRPGLSPQQEDVLRARVDELEAQMREMLDSMRKAVEAAGISEEKPRRRHLHVVRDDEKEAG